MMKKLYSFFVVILLISLLSACAASSYYSSFNGSRTGNDSQLIMDYTAFNTSDSQVLNVKAGDTIHAEIVMEDGSLSYEIHKDDELIAEGRGITASEEFDLKADESGKYTVFVAGEKAKGSIKFIVQGNG